MRLFDKIGEIPTKLQVQVGALVANIADRKLFTKTPDGRIIDFSTIIPQDLLPTSGSNANGTWTKYGDGTLVWYVTSPIYPMNQNAIRQFNFQPPVPAISGAITYSIKKDGNATTIKHGYEGGLAEYDRGTIYVINPEPNGGNCIVRVVFNGRWK